MEAIRRKMSETTFMGDGEATRAGRKLVVPPPPSELTESEFAALSAGSTESAHKLQALQKVRSKLALRHRKQRDELSKLVKIASTAGLGEHYIELLLSQIRSHDQAMEQLVGLDSGQTTLHLIGSNLIATMRSLGWLGPGRPELVQDLLGKHRAEMRYGLKRPFLTTGEWILNEESHHAFDAAVYDVSETGVGFVTPTCLSREARIRLPFALDDAFQAIASLIVVGSRQDDANRWRVAAAFTHLR
jgi:hypothetical protein